MRIAIFSDNFYPELSGISDSIIALARELSKRGHAITFCVPRYSSKNYRLLKLPEQEIALGENISVIRIPSFPYPTGTQQGRFVVPTGFFWRKLWNKGIDVIHAQLFFGTGIEALIAAKVLKKPLVGTNHTAVTEFFKYSPIRAEWFKKLTLKYVNWYYSRCDIVTAPSKSVIDEMAYYGFSKKIHVVSNPIDTENFRPSPNKNLLRKKLGFSNETIIHAGRLGSERSIDVILKAIALAKKSVPTIRLALAGKGAAENELRSLAKSLGILDITLFLGFLGKPALSEAYNASSVFVITSSLETQSLVMMQAMASGIPVIGVKARALPEYINAKNGFLVEPNNPEELSQKIVYLLKNPDVRKKLGVGARNYAKNFSGSTIAEEWEVIYEKVISEYHKKNSHR